MSQRIRVLVVEDSALMRRKLTDMIHSDPQCEVVGVAADGEECLRVVSALRPDVITLDIELPGMDGVTALQYIMSEWPTPVIMVTAFSHFNNIETIRCLEYGAVDVVRKPGGPISPDITDIRATLLAKIKLAMSANVHVLRPMLIERVKPIRRSALTVTDKVVVIATSTGGPRTLAQLLPRLPEDFPAALLIVQHMPEGFTGAMAERLNTETQITVREARHKDAVVQETALIAPGGVHMKVKIGNSGHGQIVLAKGARELGLIPTANVTMREVAPLYRERCLGVVLTGMGTDGTDGLRQIKRHGGRTLAQDKDSCVVYGMPKSAAEAEVVDKVLPLEGMASEITRWAREK